MSENSKIIVCVSIQTPTTTFFEQSAEFDPARATQSMRLVKKLNHNVRDKLITLAPDERGAIAAVGLNHDLLARALTVLIDEAIPLVEANSERDEDGAPLRGSIEPDAVETIETYLQLIRDIESEIGPTSEPEPEWFEALVDRRWSLTEKEGAE